MTDKPTDAEIKKALECCVSNKHICPHNCPMLKNKECLESLRKNALDLINRLQEKIKFAENINHLQMEELQSLKDKNKVLSNELAKSLQDAEYKQAENEKLNVELKNLTTVIKNLTSENRNLTSYLTSANADNERLKDEYAETKKRNQDLVCVFQTYKVEAYKECIEKVKMEAENATCVYEPDRPQEDNMVYHISNIRLNNLLKELVGEDNG